VDLTILFTVITLLGIGIVMVFSASAVKSMWQFGDSYYYLKRQMMWAMIGLPVMLVVMNINYWHYRRWANLALLGGLFFLVLVLIPGIGVESNDARRWIALGPIGFQPSELMKLLFVVFAAAHLTKLGDRVQDFRRGLLPVLGVVGLIGGLVLMEPDLGTAAVICGTCMVVLFVAGARLSHLFFIVAVSLPMLAWAIFSEEYRRRRFLAFLDPWSDRLDSGFHIIQSLYALGSGGLFGVGLGASRLKLFYLPEQHTDFIFAIIGEELGFIGSGAIIILFFLLAWRGYKVAVTAPDRFGSLLATGITTMVTMQALINIGVVTATLPITGIPLPFISYGGSSLLPALAGMGILLNISRHCEGG
jgi:cell division protein FtsW